MTVATSNITSGPYAGNGTTSSFSYTFRVEDKTQLKVFETDDTGGVTELTVDTDYTVNDVGTDGGGTIDRVAGNLPDDYTWYIRSNYDVLQETDYDSQGAYFPDIHEASFDKLHFLIQQLYDVVGRSFRLADSDPDAETVNLTLPDVAQRASRVLVFDSAGDLDVGSLIGTWRGDWATSTVYNERDLFIDPATNNVYFVLDDHTSTSIAADLAADDIELVIDAEYVNTQATNAAASASAAATSASAAATSETNAGNSETNAGNSETAAEAAQTAAEAAQAAAEAIYDNFDDRYLGAKASAPATDNDGDPLTNGDLYFDTTLNVLRVYDADDTTWISLPATTLVSLTDVVLSSISIGELLMWNGTAWINRTLTEAGIQAYDADTAKTDVAQVYTAKQTVSGSHTLTSSSNSVAVDLSHQYYTLNMTEDTSLAAPSNVTARQLFSIEIFQDDTTAYTLGYNTFYQFAGGSAPAISATLESKSRLVCEVSEDGTYAACNLLTDIGNS